MLEAAITPYIDDDLNERLDAAHEEAVDEITAAWEAATDDARAELDVIAEEAAGSSRHTVTNSNRSRPNSTMN